MMRVLLILLVAATGTLTAYDTIGSNRTHLGKQYIASAGICASFATPLANTLAAQVSAPASTNSIDIPVIAAVGEPCRRLHPNKEFESFAHIEFEKRNESIAHEQSVLRSDEAIADASDSILLDNGTLDANPVTNAQYREFVTKTGYAAPTHWNNGNIPPGQENYPVTNVSYEDAQNYAKWSEKRLPTANEWMSASDQLSWDLEMPSNEWSAAPNDQERAMILNRRNGSFDDALRTERNANTTFRLVSPLRD